MANRTVSGSELAAAIRGLSAARDLPPEVIMDALRAALVSAYKKMPSAQEKNVTVQIDVNTGDTRVFAHYTVVEAQYLEDASGEMTVEQAQAYLPGAKVGDTVTFDVTPRDFGRIAAQTARQVILHKIREAERDQTYTAYVEREGEIMYGTVQSTSRESVTIALDRVEAILPKSHQIPGEQYAPNQRLRVYVAEVRRTPKGPQVVVSRTHRDMLRRLMELEIPEIYQGAVEIKAIAREAGSRSKVAVWSHQSGVDPVGACVGMRGVRIQALVRELGGEKIDVVEWDPDPRVFIAHALSPARVRHVSLVEDIERRTANVLVPDDQLSLAIGREGQNARLAAKLTGWRIDIRAESEAAELLEELRAADEARQSLEAEAQPEAIEPPEPVLVEAPVATEPVPTAAPPVSVEPVATPVPAEAEPLAPAASQAAAPAAVEVPPAEPTLEDLLEDEEELGRARKKGKKKGKGPATIARLASEKGRKGLRRRVDWEEELDVWADKDAADQLEFTESDFLEGRGGYEDAESVDENEDQDQEQDEEEGHGA